MNRPSVNHIITQAIPALFSPALSSPCGGNSDQEALTYAWGADGKLANFATTIYNPTGSPSQATTTMSAHWDGDDLLYVVEAGGSNPELYVEKLGYMYLNGTTWTTTIYDRDQSGTAVDRHGGTNSGSSYAWFAQLSLDNVHPYGTAHAKCMGTLGNFSCNGVVTNPPAATAGGSSCGTLCGTLTMSAILDAGREDGYYDGTVSIQGVRAYDPNMNQWTTPDAYSGDVHDPMSQHPYMWNNNNPVQYEDPSGYNPFEDIWNFVAGDDIRTLGDPEAGAAAKVGAGLDLALTAVPEAKGPALGVKAVVKLGEKELFKAAADRFVTHSAEHGVEEGSVKVKISPDKVKIQYTDNSGVRRDVMAHNAHPGEHAVNAPHTQTATRKGGTDPGSHQPIP
jgi:RHS repeat-associated protein